MTGLNKPLSATCPLSGGGGYSCECDGGATLCDVLCHVCDYYFPCVTKANCCGAGGRENPDMRYFL